MCYPARPHRAITGLARVAACAGMLLLTAPVVPAATPPASTSRDTFRDLQLTVHARQALHEDDDLSALNIGIRVRDGVATLWGPVPAANVIPKAVKRVEAVQGILGVRHELYVMVPEKKIEDILPTPEQPLLRESAFPDPVSGSIGPLTGRDEKASVAYPAAGPSLPSLVVELGKPIAIGSTPTQPAAPAPKGPSSAPPPGLKEDLSAAIDRVRGSDSRFRRLHTEVRGNTVVISAIEERAADVMAMAQVVSRLPGVERVVTKSDAPSP